MKLLSIWLVLISGAINAANAEEFNPEKFAKDYFNAWAATQSPTATKENIEQYLSRGMGILALLSANAYVMIFNGSWGPVMWVMLGEMFPNQIRGSGLAIAGLSQWITNFAITMTFPIFLTTIGLFGAYGFYAVSAIISAIFVHKFVHETRGLELEEMQG